MWRYFYHWSLSNVAPPALRKLPNLSKSHKTARKGPCGDRRRAGQIDFAIIVLPINIAGARVACDLGYNLSLSLCKPLGWAHRSFIPTCGMLVYGKYFSLSFTWTCNNNETGGGWLETKMLRNILSLFPSHSYSLPHDELTREMFILQFIP